MAAETHPTLARIEAYRTGEAAADDVRHIESCAACQSEIAALDRLAADLRELKTPSIDVPDDVDARILWNARKQARLARRATAPGRRLLTGTRWAVAAMLLVAVAGIGLWRRTATEPMQLAHHDAADVDASGKVDIRDAFVLAKALRDGNRIDAAWDIDGNDIVDAGDVDRIARWAVSLRSRG